MLDAIYRFANKLKRAEIGFFFYAGHGMQIRGANYLIPVGTDVKSSGDVEYEAVHAGRILSKMEAIDFIHVIFYRNSLPEFPEIQGFFSDKDFWSHSWACAIACKSLGHPTIGTKLLPGELYIAGLLHGIGKLILAIHRPDDFRQCLENAIDFQQPLQEAQLDIFGTTDADIACELLKIWQLPENVSMAIKYCQCPGGAEKEHREFAGLLQLAYFIANTSGIGNIKDEFCFDVNQTWISQEPSSPLFDQKLREGFVQNIYSVLKQKQSSIEAIGSKEEDTPIEESNDQNSAQEGVVDKSWLSRLGRWLKSCFAYK